jgi:hypothetical protein
MRLSRFAIFAGVAPLLIAAASPTAEPPQGAKADNQPAKATDVVCKKFPPPVGTRIGSRQICKTQAEWDYIQAQEQEALDRAMRKPHDGQ